MPDYLNKNGETYTEQELISYARLEGLTLQEYISNKTFKKVDEPKDTTVRQQEVAVSSDNKFNPFGFLNFDNYEEFQKNSKDFFNQDEELAVVQLQKLLGENYIIEQSNPSVKDFFTKGASKSLDQIKIRHKNSNEDDFVKIDFNIGAQGAREDVMEDMYQKSITSLFDYVNKTMSKDNLSAIEKSQREILKKYNKLNAPAVFDEDGNEIKSAGPLNVSKQKKEEIKKDVNNISFAAIERQIETGFYGAKTVTDQPYEQELKTSKNQLIKSGIQNPTQEQIIKNARNNIIQTRIQELYDQKATDYMNSNNVEETDLDALLKLGSFLNKKINFETKKRISKNDTKLSNLINDFEVNLDDINSQIGLANEFIKIVSSKEPTNLNVSDKEDRIVLENGTIMAKSDYDNYLVAVSSYQQAYNEIEKVQQQLSNDIQKVKDEDVKLDLVRRNYNDGQKFINLIGTGFVDIAVKAAYGSSKLQSGLAGIDNKLIDKDFIQYQEASEIYRNKFQKDIKFEKAFNSKNMGRFLLQEVQNQAPIFATIATGPVGISVLGLSSSGENWSRIVQEDNLYGDETSLFKKMLTSAGYGAAEVVFDRYLTLPVMRRSGKSLFGNMKKFRDATKPSMLSYTKQFGKRQLLYDPALEIASEGLTTITQNIITGRPISENLDHAVFSGGLFGTAFGHVPFYKGLVMSRFSDYDSYSGFRDNLNKTADLQITLKKLNTSLKANKTKGNDTSAIEGNIETVNQEINRLQKENDGIIRTVEKKTNNLSKRWFDTYNAATVAQEQIRIDVENISKDETLSNTEKQKLIDIKKTMFDSFQATRDILRDDKNFGNAYAGFRNSDKQSDKDRLQEIQGQATTELINEGRLEPSDDAIDIRTRIIYNTQEINKDYNSKKFMLDGAGFKNFQTVDQLTNFVNKMDLSDTDKQTIISGFEQGAHGVNVVEANGNITPMQVVENMAKADRLETRTHEVGHAVFASAFGNNQEAFDGIADSVLEFVKQRNPNLHLRLLNQVQRYAKGDKNIPKGKKEGDLISEEVLTNFLELIAEGKIDIKSEKNKGLGGFIANALNLGSKKSLGEKADFNFEGETDAINFLINLGKKIKAGTLTIKDIESIKRSKIAEKVDTKPETKFSKEASDNVQRIYDKQGEAGIFDILKEFKPIVGKLVDKRSEAPNFDRQLLTDEIETGLINEKTGKQRSIMGLVKDYPTYVKKQEEKRQKLIEEGKQKEADKVKTAPLAGFINNLLPERMIEASREILGEEFTDDVSERVDIVAEEVITETKRKPTVVKEKILLETFGETDLQNEIREDIKIAGVEGIEKYLDFKKELVKHRKFMKDGTEITPELKAKYKEQGKKPPKELKSKRIPTGKYYFILEKVAASYGITDPIRLITEKDLDTKQRKAAQDKILSKRDEHIVSLPEGTTKAGDPTGIANTALGKAFFKAGGRMKFKTTGTGKGLKEQAKQRIEPMAYLEIFGLIPGNRINNSSVDPAIRSQIIQTAITATRQAAQQEKKALNLTKEAIDKLKDGKSSIMFSKEAEALANPLENWQQTYEHKLGILSQSLGLKLSNKKTFYRTNSKGKRVPYRSRDLDAMFNKVETYRDAGARVINTFLESHPQFRDLIKITTTGGLEGGFFQSVSNFNNLINKTEIEQAYIPRTKYSGDGAVYSQTHYNNLKKGKLDKANDSRLPLLLDFFKAMEAHLQNFPNDIWMFEEIILDTGKQQNVFTRILAPFTFYPVNKNKKPIFNQKIKEEHTDPQNLIGKALTSSAFFGKVDDSWNVIGKSYMQGALLDSDVNPHDKMIEEAGFASSMPDVYYEKIVPRLLNGELKLPNGYASIVRLAASGIDLNMYMLAKENVTIAEYFGVDGIINPETGLPDVKKQNDILIKQLAGEVAPKYGENIAKVKFSKNVENHNKLNKAINKTRVTTESKGITVLDFDDTLATTESLVKYTTPDGTTGTLNAEQYASTYEDLLDQGFTFDFSDFNKVVKGKLAPLFQKALKLQKKFGPENMFVLTARPPAAQKAIFDFLKANGLNIPLKNITGLANSTSEAKALWIADKVGEGYNDFYFADDALQNVQAVKNMLDQFDVKSKVQQAKVKFSKDIDSEFNKILEDVTGIEAGKRFSEQKARKRGASKGKFRFFIPPSHEDFVGLLYNFMGKGRKGDQHRDFFEQALVRPLNRAYREIDTAKQAIANDYKELNKQFADVKKKLRKKTPDGDYIFEDAIRVYLWNKHGYDIPGLSKTDQANLSELVMSDPQLQAYAETLNVISKQDTYVDPGKGWDGGNIKTDLIDATGRVGRAEYFTEFNENADIIFSEENLNKIEAAYGRNFKSAVKDILHRIKTGVNRPEGQSGTTNAFMNYLNGSVGTVMFFNVRSAILQQMSIVNYINFADNNIFAAGKAFANQPQYWKDFAFIFNSDMLKQRRGGIGTDINGNDLAQAVAGSKNPTKIVISKLLKLGFLPTQIGDNIAIATGGATFYRNRINKYIKDGLSKKEAETRAFTDFQDLTQSTQQSSRPDMTSQQQASWIGKLVLNFQNITSQYNRIIKKAALDIYNRRITPPYTTQLQSDLGNLSKILYYGGIQNVIFYSLQTALFAVMFDDDNDEDQILKKRERVIQGSIDSILRGAGIYGAVLSTLKNAYIRFKEQREKGYNKDESAVPLELANFSPVVGIKLRQLVNAEKTLNYNENVIGEMETFEADNPMWSAVTNYTQALTNFPANRLYQKSINMRNALDKDYTNFQRVLFFSGYTTWSLGLGDTEAVIEAKEKVKINKANAKKEKRAQKQIEKIAANKSIVEENKKKKDGRCAAISTSGKRCSNKAVKDGFCSIHEKVEQREDGKKLRCRKTKSDGTRCRMMTTNKSQYCYYHD